MLFFDHRRRERVKPPFFSSKEVHAERVRIEEWLKFEESRRRQTDLPLVWKLPIPADLIAALRQLSHDRCAFCEMRREDLTPYRFRPPAYALPDDSGIGPQAPQPNSDEISPQGLGKGNYIWLTFAWSNFYPICPDCRPASPTYFPVIGQRAAPGSPFEDPGPRLPEKAEILYPGEEQSARAQLVVARDGTLLPHDPRWTQTIAHFKIDREQARHARAAAIEKLIEIILRTIDEQPRSTALIATHINTLSSSECGGFVNKFIPRLLSALPASSKATFNRANSKKSLERELRLLVASSSAKADLEHSLAQIDAEDAATTPGMPILLSERQPQQAQPLRAISIRNFKSLESLDIKIPDTIPALIKASDPEAPTTPCLMILGENATGKSSILEAIALACLDARARRTIGSTFEFDPARIPLNPAFLGASPDLVRLPSKVCLEFGKRGRRSFTIDPNGGAIVPGEGRATLPLLFAYGAHRLFGQGESSGPFRHIETLFDQGRQLANPEPWLRELARTSPPALDEVAAALRNVIQIDGQFESIFFAPDGQKPGPCMLRTTRQRRGLAGQIESWPIDQPLALVSSGYRAIVAIVCDIIRGLLAAHPPGTQMHVVRRTPALVLVDEIEAHLHPRWKLNIMRGLRKALPGVTFIVSSHDPLCVRGMYGGEVVVLNRYDNIEGEGRGLPECLEKIDALDNVESMTVDQLLTSDLFQLGSTDGHLIERRFARVADLLARRHNGESFNENDGDGALLREFDEALGAGLPFGANPVTYEVQRAVADVLAERRRNSEATLSEKRIRAKDEVRKFLEGLTR